MALSGSFSGSIKSGHYKVRIDWTATQSIANNTSTITANMYLVNDWSLDISSRDNTSHSVTIDGTKTSLGSSAINTTGTHHIGSATKTVTHNADGTKTLSLSAIFAIRANISGTYYENITASDTIALDTIARASQPTVSANSVVMGSAVTINTNRASSGFTHTLTYAFGSASGTIASGVGASYQWTVPLSLANQIPNATSGTLTITCKTYNGNALIGTKTVSLTATVPDSVKPSISSITVTDPMGYKNTYGGYIQGKSKAHISVSASGSYSSTISSYKIKANGSTYTENNCTTELLTAPNTMGIKSIEVTVTDSRGRTATMQAGLPMIQYAPLEVTQLEATRCDENGNVNKDGNYMKIKPIVSMSPMNGVNVVNITIDYKKTSDSQWTVWKTATKTFEASSGYESYLWSVSYPSIAISEDDSYDVRITVSDKLTPAFSKSVIVGTAFTLIDLNASGKGIAFGKVSEKNAFEVDMDTEFKNVRTQAGADLDMVRNVTGKQFEILAAAYAGGSEQYGVTFKFGSSTIGEYVNDTYWLSIRYDGQLAVGIQVSGATTPTWQSFQKYN